MYKYFKKSSCVEIKSSTHARQFIKVKDRFRKAKTNEKQMKQKFEDLPWWKRKRDILCLYSLK